MTDNDLVDVRNSKIDLVADIFILCAVAFLGVWFIQIPSIIEFSSPAYKQNIFWHSWLPISGLPICFILAIVVGFMLPKDKGFFVPKTRLLLLGGILTFSFFIPKYVSDCITFAKIKDRFLEKQQQHENSKHRKELIRITKELEKKHKEAIEERNRTIEEYEKRIRNSVPVEEKERLKKELAKFKKNTTSLQEKHLAEIEDVKKRLQEENEEAKRKLKDAMHKAIVDNKSQGMSTADALSDVEKNEEEMVENNTPSVTPETKKRKEDLVEKAMKVAAAVILVKTLGPIGAVIASSLFGGGDTKYQDAAEIADVVNQTFEGGKFNIDALQKKIEDFNNMKLQNPEEFLDKMEKMIHKLPKKMQSEALKKLLKKLQEQKNKIKKFFKDNPELKAFTGLSMSKLKNIVEDLENINKKGLSEEVIGRIMNRLKINIGKEKARKIVERKVKKELRKTALKYLR